MRPQRERVHDLSELAILLKLSEPTAAELRSSCVQLGLVTEADGRFRLSDDAEQRYGHPLRHVLPGDENDDSRAARRVMERWAA